MTKSRKPLMHEIEEELAELEGRNTLLYQKITRVLDFFKGKKCIVAFSGGVDSSVLLALALLRSDEVLAVFLDTPFVDSLDRDFMQRVAAFLDITVKPLKIDCLANPDILHNDRKRCYHCKLASFKELKQLARDEGINYVVEGSNASDLEQIRPGMDAIKELGIYSPLLSASITKDEIREIATIFSLPTARRPSNACLATRIAKGMGIDERTLQMIEKAEEITRDMLGVSLVRVRVHPGPRARIELDPNNMEAILQEKGRELITLGSKLSKLGFLTISFDLLGYGKRSNP